MKQLFLLTLFSLFTVYCVNAKRFIGTKNVPVRAGAGKNFDSVGYIKGDTVNITEFSGSWGKVYDKKKIGFVDTKLLVEIQNKSNGHSISFLEILLIILVIIAIFRIIFEKIKWTFYNIFGLKYADSADPEVQKARIEADIAKQEADIARKNAEIAKDEAAIAKIEANRQKSLRMEADKAKIEAEIERDKATIERDKAKIEIDKAEILRIIAEDRALQELRRSLPEIEESNFSKLNKEVINTRQEEARLARKAEEDFARQQEIDFETARYLKSIEDREKKEAIDRYEKL